MDELRERVLRKKLLHDGYGTYEERKIIQMIKDVAKLYLTDLAEDDYQKLYSSTLKSMNAVLGNAEKSIKISERCDREVADIERSIQEHRRALDKAKAELDSLQLELEYVDKLKKISVFPDCPTSEAQIRNVLKRKDKLMNQVRKQRQHIVTIMNSCKELRQVLDEELDQRAEVTVGEDEIAASKSNTTPPSTIETNHIEEAHPNSDT